MRFLQGADQFLAKKCEVAFDSAGATDQHMVGARHPKIGKVLASDCAQTSLQAVANNSATNLLGDGEPNANRRIAVVTRAKLKNEARHSDTLAAVGGEEISPLGKCD